MFFEATVNKGCGESFVCAKKKKKKKTRNKEKKRRNQSQKHFLRLLSLILK